MTEEHVNRLNLFVSNVQCIRRRFAWHSAMMKHMAALYYTARDRTVDVEAIRESLDLLRAGTGLFSMFRGNNALSIAAMLSLAAPEDRAKRFSDTVAVYKLLKQAGFRASDFLVTAAFQVASTAPEDRFQTVVTRARSFYEGMKARHPLVTGSDDCIFAAMLGLSDVEAAAGLDRMERLYTALKPEFSSANGVQALAQVLVLGDRTEASVPQLLALRAALRRAGMKMENRYMLPVLGVLALLPDTAENTARVIADTFEYLRTQRGFSAWSFSRQELALFSAALTAYTQADRLHDDIASAALATSITNLLIAQQAALAAAAAASAASTASAASS